MFEANSYRVMLAGPSDVTNLRDIAEAALLRWNAANAFSRKIVLLPVRWERNAAPSTQDGRPQASINRQALAGCDLIIAIFRDRFGSDTGFFSSGTAEEIDVMLGSKKNAMLYFSAAVPGADVPKEQTEKLEEYKLSVKSKALVGEYQDESEFKDQIKHHIDLELREDCYKGFGETGKRKVEEKKRKLFIRRKSLDCVSKNPFSNFESLKRTVASVLGMDKSAYGIREVSDAIDTLKKGNLIMKSEGGRVELSKLGVKRRASLERAAQPLETDARIGRQGARPEGVQTGKLVAPQPESQREKASERMKALPEKKHHIDRGEKISSSEMAKASKLHFGVQCENAKVAGKVEITSAAIGITGADGCGVSRRRGGKQSARAGVMEKSRAASSKARSRGPGRI